MRAVAADALQLTHLIQLQPKLARTRAQELPAGGVLNARSHFQRACTHHLATV
jgi:hypothetical protein